MEDTVEVDMAAAAAVEDIAVVEEDMEADIQEGVPAHILNRVNRRLPKIRGRRNRRNSRNGWKNSVRNDFFQRYSKY